MNFKTSVAMLNGPLGVAVAVVSVAGAAYWVVSKLKDKADETGRNLGQTYADATMGESVSMIGGVNLPNGGRVSFDSILKQSTLTDGNFTWQGKSYTIVPGSWDADGYYQVESDNSLVMVAALITGAFVLYTAIK